MAIFHFLCAINFIAEWKPLPYSGELRLVGGMAVSEGFVEIYLNGEWGRICSDTMSDDEANVICRQLGYAYAVAYTPRYVCTYVFQYLLVSCI